MTERDVLLSPDELSIILKVSVKTLAVWRYTGRYNLPWVREGGKPYYKRQDVDAWLKKRTHTKQTAARAA